MFNSSFRTHPNPCRSTNRTAPGAESLRMASVPFRIHSVSVFRCLCVCCVSVWLIRCHPRKPPDHLPFPYQKPDSQFFGRPIGKTVDFFVIYICICFLGSLSARSPAPPSDYASGRSSSTTNNLRLHKLSAELHCSPRAQPTFVRHSNANGINGRGSQLSLNSALDPAYGSVSWSGRRTGHQGLELASDQADEVVGTS